MGSWFNRESKNEKIELAFFFDSLSSFTLSLPLSFAQLALSPRRMLRRLALETGHALRSSLLEGATSTTLLSEAASSTFSSSSSSPSSSLASRIAGSLLASSSGRSSFSTFVSAPAQQAAAGLADFIEPPLKEGEKRVAGEFLKSFFFVFSIDGRIDGSLSRPRPLLLFSPFLFSSLLLSRPPQTYKHQAAPGRQQTSAKSPGTTSTPCGSSSSKRKTSSYPSATPRGPARSASRTRSARPRSASL